MKKSWKLRWRKALRVAGSQPVFASMRSEMPESVTVCQLFLTWSQFHGLRDRPKLESQCAGENFWLPHGHKLE